MREGPTITTIPQQHKRVCTGCKHLSVQAMMRGHKENTDNYSCCNSSSFTLASDIFKGRLISFDSSEQPETPEWCPVLTEKKNNKQ